jgi:predicted acylesterase/phospholipase RssA
MQPFDSAINPQTYGPTTGVFELAGSAVSSPTQQSESSAGQTESATVSHPNSSSAAFPRPSVPSQVAGHHSPSVHHNSSSAVSPLKEAASPQIAVYQPSAPQHHSGLTVALPAPPGVLQPVAAHQSSSLQYTSVDVHQMLPAPDGLDPGRTISWSSSSAPASELPHPRPENSPSLLTMPLPRDSVVGALSELEAYNYQTPTASNITNQVYPVANPQNSVSLRPFHDNQSQWPTNPQQAAQEYKIPTTAGMTSHPGDRQQYGGPTPATIRVQRDGDKPAARKILSLDGGGVRGLSTLIILDYIMETLGNMRGARLEPWQEFDMIAGTSTGGLIAIMLGRLRMSVADCIKAYKDPSRNIFTPTHKTANVAGKTVDFLKAKGKFHSKPLEDCVKQMLRAQKLPEQELFVMDQDSDSPKVFVCAVEGINSDAVVIRSYKSKEFDDLYGVCKIWEAARATSAASTFFEPIKIGDRMYVDGALKHNNPIEKVDEESQGKSKFHLTWSKI